MIDLFKAGFGAPAFVIGWAEKIKELRQIALIVTQRVRAHVSFVAQVIEKLREMMIVSALHRRLRFVKNREDDYQDGFLARKSTLYNGPRSLRIRLNPKTVS